MNNERRKELARAHHLLEAARTIIISAKDEEDQAHDNLPDSLQDSEKGQKLSDNVDALDEIADSIEEHQTALLDIIEK